jgi:endonuclease-8
MPEGPEVRREADRIARVLLDQPLERVEFGLPRLARWADALSGRCVIAVAPHGKALLTHFDNGLSMYSHNQLYGKWYVCRRDRPPATNRSLRVGLHTATHSALLMSASHIEIMPSDALAAYPPLARLGPDVLDPELTWRAIERRLMEPAFSGSSLASLYLQQAFIAGIGNYLRSEILHEASLDPTARPRALTRAQRGALARATLAISRRAYETAGVTNAPVRVAALQRAGYRRRDYRFAVFDREGLPCYRCGTTIVRIEATSRRLYYCPGCQGSLE